MLVDPTILASAALCAAVVVFLVWMILKRRARDWCIVCTHYNESTAWMHEFLKRGVRIVVYECGVQPIQLRHSLLEIRDKTGDKSSIDGIWSYYDFCTRNYKRLPEHILFVHGHDTDWHQRRPLLETFKWCKRIVEADPDVKYINLSQGVYPDWIGSNADHRFFLDNVRQSKLLERLSIDPPVTMHEICCAQAYVHRSRIRQRPLKEWKMLSEITSVHQHHSNDNYASEGIFHKIMGEPWERPIITRALSRDHNANQRIDEIAIRVSRLSS